MTTDPQEIQSLFLNIVALAPDERDAALERDCADQPEVRRRVEALLAAHDQPDSFLDESPDPLGETVDSAAGESWAMEIGTGAHVSEPAATADYRPDFESGTVIAGRYTLQEKIGEGGMGEVWVAKQTEPVKRRVALKLIKQGMDSKAVLGRFEQERQALAMMDHPNIARVLDGGVTPTGQPFFVMELVNGLALTKFCDDAQLSPQERLELFVPICQAVQHAHQKGIVHRDLKPSNILVTIIDGRPVPKVIDFGVAKATGGKLTDETMTQFGAVVGTLEYMSPEQAGFAGVDVDTRADIYSLGVILYELLTGLRPIDAARLKKAALTEMIRIIQEEEPSKPSTRLSTDASLPSLAAVRKTDPKKLTALLRGELDWVVMKCLEKQRDRRYETANALLRDVQRYLANEPVEARPPSTAYRLRKFLRRNKGKVTAASLVLLALIGGIIGTGIGMVRAEEARQDEAEQRARAEVNERKAKDAADAERIAKNRAQGLATANAKLAGQERDAKNRALEATREKERQLSQAKASLFTTQMTRIAAVRETDPTKALELLYDLEACPIELRDAAWRFSERMCNRRTLATIQHRATLIALSPDGKLLAAVRNELDRVQTQRQRRAVQTGEVTLLDVPSGKVRAVLPKFPEGLGTPVFSPDGGTLAIVVDPPMGFRGQSDPKPGKVILWDLAAGKEAATIQGHKDRVSAVAFSPDGTTIATGSGDRTAKLWDVKTGKEKATLHGHTKAVAAVVFSPDGKRIATGGLDNAIKLWQVEGGKPLTTMTGATNPDPLFVSFVKAYGARGSVGFEGAYQGKILDGISSLAFSPDGRTLASGNSNWQIEFWDAVSGQSRLVIRGEKRPIHQLRFHSGGRSVFSGDGYNVKRWDAASGHLLFTMPQVRGMGLNRDANRLAVAFLDRIEFLDVDAPVELATVSRDKVTGYARAAAFSGSGEVLAVACGKEISLWDVRTGKLRGVLTGHKHPVSGFSLSPDGRTLATSTDYDGSSNRGKDKPARDEIRVWDIVTGKSLGTIEVGEPHVPAIAFSPDGGTLAAIVLDENAMTRGKTARISLFDLKTRKPVGTLDKGREVISTLFGRPSLAYSPDGDTLAAGAGREVSLWNVRERNLKRRIPISGSFAETSSVRFLRDGRTLAILVSSPGRAGSYGGGIELRDAATGALTGRIREVGGALVSTPDGKSLLSMAGSRGLAFCDPASAQVRTTFPLQAQTVAISSDGRIVATALNSGAAISNMPKEGTLEIKFWDVGPPQTVAMFPQEGGGLMPDGKTLALWSGSEEPIELWDLHPLRRRAVIETLTVDSFCRAVRPDGKVLALGGSSGSERDRMMARFGGGKLPGQVSLWDTGTGKNLKTFEVGRGLVLSITYSPDGRQLAVVNSIRSGQERNLTITIWNPDAGRASVAFPLPKTSGRLCTFSPDGNVLAFNAEDGRVILIDLTKRTFLPALKVKGRSNLLDRLKFTKDGRRLIVHRGGGPGVTTIWDWHAGTEVREPIPAEFRNPAISRDGRYQLERTSAGLRLIDRSWKARQSRGVRNPRWKG